MSDPALVNRINDAVSGARLTKQRGYHLMERFPAV